MTDDAAGAWDEIYSHDGRRAEYPDIDIVDDTALDAEIDDLEDELDV